MRVTTLLELYELVDELLEEYGEDMPVLIHNPISDSLEPVELSPIEEFSAEDAVSGDPCIVIHTDIFLEDLDDDSEGE